MNHFDDGNRYVVVVMDVTNGNPETDEAMQHTSPFTIRQMCNELRAEHPVMSKADIIRAAAIMAKQNGMVLGDNYPPAFDEMAWGDWREVAQHRKLTDKRLFIVKVVDAEITEIDRKYRAGQGGGW